MNVSENTDVFLFRNGTCSDVTQKLIFAGKEEGKLLALRNIFHAGVRPPVLIFVQSKDRVRQLYHQLKDNDFNMPVGMIHADQPLHDRENMVKYFRIGKVWVLICTELLARGIDFKAVNCVINFDFPQTTASYIHRIGRTGRAGRKGEAYTLFTELDAEFLRSIVNVMKISGCEVPDWMLSLKPIKYASTFFFISLMSFLNESGFCLVVRSGKGWRAFLPSEKI